jgi:hypothetical protein
MNFNGERTSLELVRQLNIFDIFQYLLWHVCENVHWHRSEMSELEPCFSPTVHIIDGCMPSSNPRAA